MIELRDRCLRRGERCFVVKLGCDSDGLADVVTENPRAIVCHAVVLIVYAPNSDADDGIRTSAIFTELDDFVSALCSKLASVSDDGEACFF